ncbi:MAG: hypothetical protein JW915_00790 [Chitinispirillaceae bacterium]|nr:hypothetical protein [Chitinispirillaceae bacterium]
MKKVLMVVAIIGAGLMENSYACYDPALDWAVGIYLNNNEVMDFTVFTAKGENGVNFYFNGDALQPVYTFRSHYDPDAQVELEFAFGDQPPEAEVANKDQTYYERMGNIRISIDTSKDRSSYDFPKAVEIELEWLNEMGIVNMQRVDREKIVEKIADGRLIFSKDLSSHEFMEFEDCRASVASPLNLPSKEFKPLTSKNRREFKHFNSNSINIIYNGVRLSFSGVSSVGDFTISIFDMQGKRVDHFYSQISSGSVGLVDQKYVGIPDGHYIAVLNGVSVQKCIRFTTIN